MRARFAFPVFVLVFLATACVVTRPYDAAELERRAQGLANEIYVGEQVYYLSAAQEEKVDLVIAELNHSIPGATDGAGLHYWVGYFNVLKAEDARSRGDQAKCREHYELASSCLALALRIDPGHAWSRYESGICFSNLGRLHDAASAFECAHSLAEAALSMDPESRAHAVLRTQSLLWLGDTRLRLLDFAGALASFETLRKATGTPGIERSQRQFDVALYARDFDAASANLRAREEQNPPSTSIFAEQGYLSLVSGRADDAAELLARAIEWEAEPSAYPRLWLWASTKADRAEIARKYDFALLADPDSRPTCIPEWDGLLLDFFRDEGFTEQELSRAAELELARRREAMRPHDDLTLEMWTYIGLRREAQGAVAPALEAYVQALQFDRSSSLKWEFELARRRYSELQKQRGERRLPLAGDSSGALQLCPNSPLRRGRDSSLLRVTKWRCPELGDTLLSELRAGDTLRVRAHELRAGNLVQALVAEPEGDSVTLIVGIDL